MSYDADTLASIRQAIARPMPTPQQDPAFSAWSLLTAIPRGATQAVAEVGASLSEVAAGLRYMRDASPDQMRGGLPDEAFQSDLADTLRDVGRSYAPDPVTAHGAERVLFGFSRGATKLIGAGVTAGLPGVLAISAEEANTQAEELKRQGVTDKQTRQQAALVQGAGFALAALPVAGQTVAGTAALVGIGGPGAFVATNELTRRVLTTGGYEQAAKQFDPLDPVGLAVSTLIPAAFGGVALRSSRAAAAARAEADFQAGPLPSEPTAVASAARETVAPEVVDAARVMYAVEQRASSRLGGRLEDHEDALARAEAAVAAGEPVQVSDAAISRPIVTLRDFMAGNKVEPEPMPPEVRGDFIGWLQRAGGIDFAAKLDVTGEGGGVLGNPGGVFRKGGRGLDELARQAATEGFYLRPEQAGDTRAFVDLVQQAVRGERVLNFREQMEAAARDQQMQSLAERLDDVTNRLQLLGVDTAPAGGNVALLEAYAKQHEPTLLRAALDELSASRGDDVLMDGLQQRARVIAADIRDAGRTVDEYAAEIAPLSPTMRRLVDAELQRPEPVAAAAEPAPQGKPRDLRAEVIALRRSQSVLSKLMDCLA